MRTYVGVGENEFTNLGVQSVPIDALASCQHQGRARAVCAVSSGNHLRTWTEDIGELTI